MKVKKIVIRHSMLLKLKLIKTKMYLKKESYPNLKIEDVAFRLKKGLQVIFKFHASRKKILFVGNLSSKEETAVKKMLKNTRHVFVPEYLWSNGRILNNKVSPSYIPKCSLAYEISRLKNNNHLTILLNSSKSDIKIENYKAKTPTIVLSNNIDIFDVTSSYKILGNFIMSNQKVKSHLFLILLQSFLRKFTRVLVRNKKLKSLRQKFRSSNNKFRK